ncbi:MAG TPA: AbrB family transcriptional regulator [Alphaproteobacteria bacterium]|nr:AbrB family transcriptional regulator [Alphaproteobacteria bacterium]
MEISSVTSKFQATIPFDIRNFLEISKGDKIGFEIDKKSQSVTIKKIKPLDYKFYKSQEAVLADDWLSDEDEEFFKDW